MLFVIFFPHMIAGPIVHHKEIIPQFVRKPPKAESEKMMVMGLTVFIIGLFKKVAIADNMGGVADPVFMAAGMGNLLTMPEAWLGVTSYTLQIYFDFSGYSDMAVGLAALFGVRMPVNFLSPYKSADIIGFWRRWHITLSRLLREYLYIPLGGNRRGALRRYANLMITMLLGGLWHGANWTFVIWGALHGAYLVVNHAWKKFSPWRLPRAPAVLLTFLSVMAAWVFFRADSAATAFHMLECMTGKYGVLQDASARLMRINEKWYILWIALALAFFAPNTHELMRKNLALDIAGVPEIPVRFYWKPSGAWAAGLALMAAVSLLLLTKVNAFIYFQF
jgi:D-alanyl-lipoteichoic acid acyltransferase DltB (MBOAT superfamily)